jgi:hypothetical protein
MEVLDYIDIAASDPEHVAAAVIAYMTERKSMVNSLDIKIRIAVCKTSKTVRAGRNERTSTLAQLVSVTGVKTWASGVYRFDFTKPTFLWGDKELYMTAGEVVALYQRLVRKQVVHGWAAFYSHMKRKHGNGFLKGEV